VCGIGGVVVKGNVVVIGHIDAGCGCFILFLITEVVPIGVALASNVLKKNGHAR
jgi:hypothetical protein